MLTLSDEEAHLRSANDHLRNAVYLISVQQDRVERQRAVGLDTVLSDALLSLMNATLRNFIQHRLAICEAVRRARVGDACHAMRSSGRPAPQSAISSLQRIDRRSPNADIPPA